MAATAIREYETRDAGAVRECYVELQDDERLLDPHLRDGQSSADEYLSHMFRRCSETEGKVFVAEAEGRVVGFVSIWAKVVSRAVEEEEYEYAYVSDLVVLRTDRGRGVGRALLGKAEEYARLRGARRLRINVHAKNGVARRLYESCGFRERVLELSKSLPGAR
ncbi:MAG TPA: GNAT family N-acetyltransferase [Pyrinomonadaceae bacterium]|nr:GNAT family N-acetyltransferase [Pyrinomonadaceae bacterium]